jgi:hypothetical protein
MIIIYVYNDFLYPCIYPVIAPYIKKYISQDNKDIKKNHNNQNIQENFSQYLSMSSSMSSNKNSLENTTQFNTNWYYLTRNLSLIIKYLQDHNKPIISTTQISLPVIYYDFYFNFLFLQIFKFILFFGYIKYK